MPAEKVRVEWEGQEYEAVPVHVVSSQELWSTYLLEDGATLKFRPVMIAVLRLVGAFDPDGNPVYMTRTQNIAAVEAPTKLRKQG
jgi:hypothetical protein